MTAKIDPERTHLSIRLGAAVSGAGFIVWCTLAVSGFMRDTRAFQTSTTETLESYRAELSKINETVGVLGGRQTSMMSDRWRYTDMQPWTYQLERANRDLLRDGGGRGLVVPEPVAKPSNTP